MMSEHKAGVKVAALACGVGAEGGWAGDREADDQAEIQGAVECTRWPSRRG
jgi:hypothetical protein